MNVYIKQIIREDNDTYNLVFCILRDVEYENSFYTEYQMKLIRDDDEDQIGMIPEGKLEECMKIYRNNETSDNLDNDSIAKWWDAYFADHIANAVCQSGILKSFFDNNF